MHPSAGLPHASKQQASEVAGSWQQLAAAPVCLPAAQAASSLTSAESGVRCHLIACGSVPLDACTPIAKIFGRRAGYHRRCVRVRVVRARYKYVLDDEAPPIATPNVLRSAGQQVSHSISACAHRMQACYMPACAAPCRSHPCNASHGWLGHTTSSSRYCAVVHADLSILDLPLHCSIRICNYGTLQSRHTP